MAQLEYNLPILILGNNPMTSFDLDGGSSDDVTTVSNPVTAATAAVGADTNQTDSGTTDDSSSPNSSVPSSSPSLPYQKLVAGNAVPDIVELLVALGVVQLEDVRGMDAESDGLRIQGKSKQQPTKQPRYAVASGQPRQFVVTPSNVLWEIAKARDEIEASFKRQELLRQALDPATSDKRAAQILERIAMQYPQAVADDPVYVTALRNMHVDVVSLLRKQGPTHGSTSSAAALSMMNSGGERAVVASQGKPAGTKRSRDNAVVPVKKKFKKFKKSPSQRINGEEKGRRRGDTKVDNPVQAGTDSVSSATGESSEASRSTPPAVSKSVFPSEIPTASANFC